MNIYESAINIEVLSKQIQVSVIGGQKYFLHVHLQLFTCVFGIDWDIGIFL